MTKMTRTEQLDAMAFKIGQEGLEYFLANYLEMVPDIEDLRRLAAFARLALLEFEDCARVICAEHGIEYEQ